MSPNPHLVLCSRWRQSFVLPSPCLRSAFASMGEETVKAVREQSSLTATAVRRHGINEPFSNTNNYLYVYNQLIYNYYAICPRFLEGDNSNCKDTIFFCLLKKNIVCLSFFKSGLWRQQQKSVPPADEEQTHLPSETGLEEQAASINYGEKDDVYIAGFVP